jgi:hypothetical protein
MPRVRLRIALLVVLAIVLAALGWSMWYSLSDSLLDIQQPPAFQAKARLLNAKRTPICWSARCRNRMAHSNSTDAQRRHMY